MTTTYAGPTTSGSLTGGFELPWAFESEHLQWRDTVRRFVADRVEPGAAERSIASRFDPDLVRRAGELGMFGLLVDPEYGGAGADLRTLCLTVEELATVDSSLAVTVHVQTICAALLQHLAKDRPELLREILPSAATGETFISIGLTEPSGGSDAGNIATTARPDGDGWIINGAKQFITNSGTPFSKYVILMCAVGENTNGRPPVSAFLVPLDAPGVTVGGRYPKLGWRSSDTHPLFFDEVRVPAEALLSEPGRGYRDVLEFLTWARLPIAAMSAGLASGCLADTLRFVEERASFGRPLGAHQGVAFQVADIAALAATARTLTYDGAWKYDHGLPIKEAAATAKLVASEAAVKAASVATQLQGGYGFIEETASTRHYQDARILTVGEGTSEVQRMLIARSLGLSV
ncbi:acyl-CoA dehydrogenase family protein [Pseudonocardia sp. WMMC193]|uniref:acyl-CoA dehydrogenase family protein n=1 Tax=Pseudonocardia sp. WMMC193 TaxID=2911965 RepID=UPI001F1E8A96|nr:acyl-CoA dehydrogenase family protein [Pseudonocardia sp. WMMC193]MCF7551365.1 acyl-CoA dehydrogenase family protein [Pseudonocardia sp. WMMC193]